MNRDPVDARAAGPDKVNGSPPRGRVLVIDTDPGVRWALEKGLRRTGYDVVTASGMAEGLSRVEDEPVAVAIVEVLPEAGLTFDAVTSLVEIATPPQIVCMSIDASPKNVMECMRRGAGDFLTKPFSLSEVRDAIGKAFDRASKTGLTGEASLAGSSALIGLSPTIHELRRLVRQAARTDLNCLVRGPSGVGKDVVAREIHRQSNRSDKPFIKVNCTALPENLLESELFGYEKGAFTGADTAKPGRFSLANKGIIFLDEIGDMHPYVQAKILQVIEHKEFTKLGGGAPVKVDVQVIAATNADLEKKIEAGLFRDDLYFRLNEVAIWVQPLAERREDIPILVRHFISKHSHYGQSPLEISGATLEQMVNYNWPGNVRELESTIKRWLALGKSTGLGSQTPGLRGVAVQTKSTGASPESLNGSGAAEPSAQKRNPSPDRILQTLEECQWNRRKAAESLGISYSVLRRNIEKYELDKRRRA